MNDSVLMSSGQGLKSRLGNSRNFVMQPAMLVGVLAILGLVVLIFAGRLTPVEGALGIAGFGTVALLAARYTSARGDGGRTGERLSTLDVSVEAFARALTEPTLIINERAVLTHANPAAIAQFPRAKAGDPLAFTLRDPDLVKAIEKALAGDEPQRCQIHIAAPNETWFRASVAPYRPEGEDRAFAVITLYDFTEQKRADRMRSDFIANASHELRTPLTSLMGFIDTLQGPAAKDAKARERFLGIMRSQSERMSGLIDDLLSLSRIELRQHVRPTTPVNLNNLVREVAESLEPRLEKNGIVLEIDMPEEPVSTTGDRQELFEVLENLADNAIKYGGDGGKIEIALTPSADRSGNRHAISVTDHGPGVAEEHVPRLTERFYRVDAESSRKKKGTGLGLAIVKHIVARHHGQMSIRSRLGEGTRVEILLPR